ncbi:DNA mismatch endonuclease Vsr [Burkholderia pseudomallei]|uniref:very short patch repair endonuclease n=1 Tax=Burkholderia pseudomallei TaxID=28450 RepID=UPI0009770DE0|nr:very short patch repair endonuclease [Burkholderia pseudomallei]NAX10194.1 DNA mismatch endonuclease Vsr [Burkholderia pseudomallei]NAX98993.1 DNA mismatch endonuclease Vsr [Burkholderia pseudomallei]NAY17626.1 DNA mismatch endonuclease Vsr [Burkholderia pseudomallei]NAY24469.1 DNA mismatch endonuclease Vsr [Burkholderia pseudomallei]NAY31400.1 DNA mismatch endonuclease Vsr [Burkholderia pseudomallei]
MAIGRSENMRRIRSKDTEPELVVRRLVYAMGYRYRLHRKDIPGKPDLAFLGRRKVIFIHGCFWHQHPGCREGRPPKSNTDYWLPKLRRNQERDRVALAQLAASGWEALVIWECETKDSSALAIKIDDFLQG